MALLHGNKVRCWQSTLFSPLVVIALVACAHTDVPADGASSTAQPPSSQPQQESTLQPLNHRLDTCAAAFVPQNSSALDGRPCHGLYGRVLKGRRGNETDFATLTDDKPHRRVVFVLDDVGLRKLVGLNGYQLLVAVGWTPAHIRDMINDSELAFKLLVFGHHPDLGIIPDTWENMIKLVGEASPSAADKVRGQLPHLRTVSMAEIERRAGYNFSEVEKAGPADPRYMTVERLEKANGTLPEVRQFLHSFAGLTEIIYGEGDAPPTANGVQWATEYMMPDVPLERLGDYRLIDIDVVLPA